ncbi:signal peptide peptidase SppA [Gallaecimonas sp. GXIMD4217]|uniref:signal peptide peptidase SppA n=1 Tax=Gallaecimonas sp. GXIMD4217 TaxID=3131927 RepID=UPI00311AD657
MACWIWQGLNTFRRVVLNLLFLIILIAFLASLGQDDGPKVPKDSALVMNIEGRLVEQAKTVDPVEAFAQELSGSKEPPEMEVSALVDAIKNAKEDKRIKALVLDLEGMAGGGLNKIMTLGDAIDDFKESGKPVIAKGDFYTQGQYLLAAHADSIYLNEIGFMSIDGFGRYRVYFKSLLDKLKINTHVFRVGTFKSAIEPYIRDDMSEPAKEANRAFLGALWSQYQDEIVRLRGLEPGSLDKMLANLPELFAEANGEFAQLALNLGLVDELKSRQDMTAALIELVGKDKEGKSFKQVSIHDYLKVINNPLTQLPKDGAKVGIVVAAGTILDGDQPVGTVGGDSTAALLRQARFDDDIKAVVLRVDSPGGSAFASEIIRKEVEALQKAGKPVVASMSTYAASGGYWISASADEIWAHPATITGSIGIFGLLTTFENSLDAIGVHTDGVGTSNYAGYTPLRPLNDDFKAVIQRSVERGYERFLTLVADNRDMSTDEVDKIAQGRVWIGQTALELGLVDKLGGLDDAVASAAKLAKLDSYDTQVIKKPLSPKEQFIKNLLGEGAQLVARSHGKEPSWLTRLLGLAEAEMAPLTQMNDPQNLYIYCRECEVQF